MSILDWAGRLLHEERSLDQLRREAENLRAQLDVANARLEVAEVKARIKQVDPPSPVGHNLFRLGILIAVELLVPLVYGLSQTSWSVVAVGIGIAAASGLVGALLGALFGVPRAEQATSLTSSGANRRYVANTNLEQVSDWVTKILIGVGLTQIAVIPSELGALADWLSSGLEASGNDGAGRTLALVEVLLFGVSGFFFGYLWAALVLLHRLIEVDSTDSRASDRTTDHDNNRSRPAR
jgi:hypothetical protein